MNEYRVCELCTGKGQYSSAVEQARVPSHVRCFSHESFTVWRCPVCASLHSLEPINFERYYAEYPFRKHRLDFHTRVAYAKRLRLLRSQGLEFGDAILDYGCGQGLFVDFLRSAGYRRAAGYDPFSPRFADAAVLGEPYDFVVSYDVIEHVPDPREYLRTLVRLVAPQGKLVLSTPNAAELPITDPNHFPVELSQPYHRHIFSERALLDFCREEGLFPEFRSHRFYFDTLVPTVNTRFMWTYIQKTGGMLDVAVEPPRWGFILRSPELLLWAFLGYVVRMPGNMMFTFRRVKSAVPHQLRAANG